MFSRSSRATFEEQVHTGESLLTVRDLKKYYEDDSYFADPVKAVDGVDLDVLKGETLGLVGESGCGKTTLGRTLVGLDAATAGSVTCRGTEITGLSGGAKRQWQRNAQVVFQDPQEALDDRMTVGEIIREPMDAHGWERPIDRRERVFELLEQVGLAEEHYYRYPHQFSGGQRQRIGIARALGLEPEFLVLDEPVSALDVSVQARVINLLAELQAELDLTYLFIAHDLSVVRQIADRVAVMYLGNIVETGPTAELFADPAHPYTASLLSAVPGSTARRQVGTDHSRITLHGSPPNPRDPPTGCPFATRCPAKIRPDDHSASEQVWVAVDEFRGLLRERSRRDTPVTTVLKHRLGVGEDDTARTARAELFSDLNVPASVATELDTAVNLATTGDYQAATTHLREAFGSECDRIVPSDEQGGSNHESRCLRNGDEHEDTSTVLTRRFGNE